MKGRSGGGVRGGDEGVRGRRAMYPKPILLHTIYSKIQEEHIPYKRGQMPSPPPHTTDLPKLEYNILKYVQVLLQVQVIYTGIITGTGNIYRYYYRYR